MAYERQYSRKEVIIRQRIGRNIRRAREESGLTLDKVALALRQPKSKLSEIEQGQKAASSILMTQLAELFDVSVAYLYSGKDMGVGEELFFDVNKVVAPIRYEMEHHFAVAVAKLCAAAFPAQSQTEILMRDVKSLIERFDRVVSLNNELWQEMRGGNNLNIQLNQLKASLNATQQALNLYKRAKKETQQPV